MKFVRGLVFSAAVFCFCSFTVVSFGNGNSELGWPTRLGTINATNNGAIVFGQGPPTDGANSLNFLARTDPSLTRSDTATPAFSFDLAQMGLNPGSGAEFQLFGADFSNLASNSGDASNQGWTPFLQTAFGSYTVVPEPSTITLVGLAALSGLIYFRRKK
jgi:hypothetical protein